MKKISGTCLFVLMYIITSAQSTQSFDMMTYLPPKGWTKEVKENQHTSFTTTNKKTKAYCQIFVLNSTKGTGNIDNDTKEEWQKLVASYYSLTDTAVFANVESNNGWQVQEAVAPFSFNNGISTVMMRSYSANERVASVVVVTNSTEYMPVIENFMNSVEMKKPESVTIPDVSTPPIANNGNFAFTTTNFDDGWTSTIHDDWVQVSKGNTIVLLHFSSNKINPANTDIDVTCAAAWNALVAPRYSDMENYKITPSVVDYQRPYYVQAYVTDKVTGKKVFVALFKKGDSGWIEIISPDQNSFIQNFGVDLSKIDYYTDGKIWEPLQKLSGYNKFAVAASDLVGKWTSNFTGMQQYVYATTGANAGMNTHSSSELFEFMQGGNYNWELKVASGFVGNIKFQGVQSNGQLTMANNWQINFSDIEKKPRVYNAYFSCIKGARILWLQDTGYGDYKSFGKVE